MMTARRLKSVPSEKARLDAEIAMLSERQNRRRERVKELLDFIVAKDRELDNLRARREALE